MSDTLNGKTRLFPILGDPIEFVESPHRMSKGFAERGCNAICLPMKVHYDDLPQAMAGLSRTGNVDGLLITMPHKAAARSFCATLSERSELLGVVSVMRRNADDTWHGDMLDGVAFLRAQEQQGARPSGARALLVGAGGAGSAIAIALLEAGVRELVIHDSDMAKAAALAALLSHQGRSVVLVGPPDPAGFDMVCNATSAGMAQGDPLPVAADALAPPMFVGDVIAGHGITPFVQAARDAGCRTATGVHMVEAAQQILLDFMLKASST